MELQKAPVDNTHRRNKGRRKMDNNSNTLLEVLAVGQTLWVDEALVLLTQTLCWEEVWAVEAKEACPGNKVRRCLCRMDHKAFRWDRIREVPVVPGEACLKGCTRTTCKRRWRWRRRRRCCNNKA